MNKKIIMGLVLLIAIAITSIAVVSAADVEITRDFDNTTVYHTVKSDSSSQAVYGLENNAKLIGRDKVNHTEPVSKMANTEVKVDDGYYTYQNLVDENGIQLKPTDKVKFNYNRTLTAVYKFTPYMFAEIDVLDLHGHSSSSATYPTMKTASDSITKTFKEYTDVEEGYRPLYILDIDTNTKYQPGDKFTITYQDVVNTGMTKIIKTFQYVYAKDIVIENIIVENRTIFNDTIVNRTIFNDTIINRDIYNDTIINRTIYNDTIINRDIYNDTIINRDIYNDTIINRDIYNDTVINRTFYNDTIINREIFNDTIINRELFNDTIVNRTIFNDTIIDRIIYNDTIVNRTIENITYVNKIVENITYINKTIEIPKYVTKIIEIPIYVTKIVENPKVENKTMIKNKTKDTGNVTKEIKVKEEIKNVPETIPTKEVVNEPVKKVVNNTNIIQNNKNKTVRVLNNNTTKTNAATTNINDENNTSTPTSNNVKTVKMKETGNQIGWIILFIFIIALATFAIRDKE